jgi:hypothetical protein
MAGTADNFLTNRIALGPGKIYGNLGGTSNAEWDLGAGVRLLLHTDGSPNATQNPNAVHLGMTEGGEQWSVKPTKTDLFADEFTDPIASRVTAEEIMLAGSLLQISDMAVQAIMNPTATRSDVGGSEGLTWGGGGAILYRSFAVIWPIEGSTTLFQVFHIYKGYNDAGIAAQITKSKLGASPFAIRGYSITTRTAGDQAARFFRQSVGAGS